MTELEWLEIFSNTLINMMQDVGMSQRELASLTGISETTISRYLHKQQMPSVKAIVNIAYAFDFDVTELVDFGDTIN